MVFDTTQLIIDSKKKQADAFGSIADAVPIHQNNEGMWVDTVKEPVGDLSKAVPIDQVDINLGGDQPVLVEKNATEVPTDLSDYLAEKYKAGKAPLFYGAIGELVAKGEISVEEGIELGNKEHMKNLEQQGRLEIMKAQQGKIGEILGGATQFLPFAIDSTIEAAKGAMLFGTGAALTAILTGGATTPLIPGLMAAGGTYGVIKNSIDVEGMGIYLDLLRDGVDSNVALPLAVAAGTAIGITEVYSLKLFGAGFRRRVVEAMMTQLGKKALLNMVAFHVKTTGIQVGQEFVQETVEHATKFFASILDSNPDAMPTIEEMVESYKQLASLETVGGLALLSAPGAVGVGVQTQRLNAKQAMAEVNKKIDEKREKEVEKAGEEKVSVEVTEPTDEEVLQEAVEETLDDAALEIEAAAAGTADEEGNQGSSFSASGRENLLGTPNIAVSIFPDLSLKVEGRLTPETAAVEIGGFRELHKDLLAENPELAVGTFYSEDTNTTFIDLVSIVPESQLEEAKALGREYNQISVFNLRTFEEIETGGTGEAIDVSITPQERVDTMREIVGTAEAEKEGRVAEILEGAEKEVVGGQFSGGEKFVKGKAVSKPAVEAKTKVNEDGQTKAEVEQEKEVVKQTKKKIEVKRKDISGRINKLTSEKKAVHKEIDAIGKEFKKGNLTEEQLDRKLEKQFNELLKIDDELVPLQLLEDASGIDLGAVKVELRANEVRALQLSLVREKAVAMERGIKAGQRISRAEILELQNEVIALVAASEATEATKRNALKAMRKIQTERQADKVMPELIAMLDRSAEKAKKSVLVDKFKKLTKSKVVQELRPEIKKEVTSILEAFTAVKPSKIKVAKVIEALRENEGNELTDEQLLHLAGLDRKPLRDLSLQDVQYIHDAVSHLIWVNTEVNKVMEQERTKKDMMNVEEAVSNLGRKYKDLEGSVEGLDSLQKEEESKLLGVNLGGVADIAGVGSYNMELIGEILDGQDNGIIQRIMYREIDKGEAKSLKYKHEAEDYFIRNGLRDILKDDSWSEFFSKKFKKKDMIRFTLESGQTINISKGTRIAFMLHARNEDSRRHLLEGGFVLRRFAFAKVKKLTEKDLDFISENASADEKKVADLIYGYFNTIQKQAINETSVDLLGFEVAVVQNYFPIHVSGQALTKEERIKNLSDANNFIKETLEGMGIFKRRVKSNAPLVVTDAFEVTHQQIQKVSAYVGLAAPLRRAKALLHAPNFKAALENAGLGKYRQSMEDYLGRVEGDAIRNDAFDKLTQKLINKLDVAILAGNVGVFFKQPVSYFLAGTEMSMKYIATSFKPVVSKSLIAEIKKWNPHFRDRFEGNVTREMGEVASVGRTRRFFTGRELLSNKLMVGIKTFDTMAIGGIWRATKKEIADKNPSLKVGSDEFMRKVSDRAWEVARRTQPTFAIKDRSTIGRKQNTFWRLATKYSSQRNKNWMIQRRAFEQYNRSEKTVKDFAKLTQRMLMIRMIAPAMIAGVNAVRGLGRDDVDDEENRLLKRFFADWITVTLGDVYIISNILQGMVTQVTEGGKGFGMTDPLTANFAKIGTFIANVVKEFNLVVGITKVKSRRDWEKKQDKIVKDLFLDGLDIGSKLSGLPVDSARRSLELTGKAVGVFPKSEDTSKIKRQLY